VKFPLPAPRKEDQKWSFFLENFLIFRLKKGNIIII